MTITQFPPRPAHWSLDRQAIAVPGTEKPGYTPIFRNAVIPEMVTQETCYDLFSIGRDKGPNNPFLGRRPFDPATKDVAKSFEWITYGEAEELRTAIGSGLSRLVDEGKLGEGVPQSKWCVGIWCQNRPEYQLIDLSLHAYNRLNVSLYESYDQETAAYILDHAEAKVCFTTSSHVYALLTATDKLPHLKAIVLIDSTPAAALPAGELPMDQVAKAWAKTKGIHLYAWNELLQLGREKTYAHTPPLDNNELAGYCYTSGTTGKPKGAMIAHRSLAISAGGVSMQFEDKRLKMLSYLPLAHIYERILEAFVIRMGGAIGYFSGDVLRLIEDAQVLQPEFFPGVPRVFNRVAAQIQAQAEGDGLKAKLLRTALASKIANHDADGSVTHAFWDRLVFRKVKMVLGGKVELMLSGSAPIRPDVLKLLRVAFCCDVREGYGQTENAGTCLIMFEGDNSLGTCGPIVPGHELRLKDCPELGYTSQDKPHPRGEILSRGQSIFPGYFKDEAKTKETLDSEGWLYSGDVGLIDEKGRVKIIDRVKNLVKLSQGEYVAIEHIEGIFAGSRLCAQLWLYGDSYQPHLVTIAVPDPETFAPFASGILGTKIASTDLSALEKAASDEKVTRAFLLEVVKEGKKAGLKGFEFPRALKLRMQPFTAEEGLLTPTFKFKRPEAKKILAKDLDELYAQQPADISGAKL